MGKGDKKSRRGKIIIGTYGVRRHRKKASGSPVSSPAAVVAEKPVEKKKQAGPVSEIKAAAAAEVKETKEIRENKTTREPKKAATEKKAAKTTGTPKESAAREKKGEKGTKAEK